MSSNDELPLIQMKNIRRKSIKDVLKDIISCQYEDIISKWWDDEEDEINEAFQRLKDINKFHQYRDKLFDTIKEYCFNSWYKNYNFYTDNKEGLSDFTIGQFIKLFEECQKWFKDEFDTDIQMKNEEHAWNTIVYWIVKTDTKFREEVNTFLLEQYNDYLEYERPCRFACGICYENTILYTGCSACNNNYICKECYKHLEKENECPFCRCDCMIDGEPPQTAYSQDQIDSKCKLMKDLINYSENVATEVCDECQGEIRYNDKSHYKKNTEGVECVVCDHCGSKECVWCPSLYAFI